jgi:butyryl-CoA dehydrogenase
MKRAMTGQLALLPAIKRVMDEITEPQLTENGAEGPLANERHILGNAKKLSLFAAGAASQKHMQDLQDQQEIMGALADCISEVYALESCVLRAEKLLAKGGNSAAKRAIVMTQLYAARALQTVEASAKKVISAVAEGDLLRMQMAILRRLSKHEPANTIALSRDLAQHVIKAGRYSL